MKIKHLAFTVCVGAFTLCLYTGFSKERVKESFVETKPGDTGRDVVVDVEKGAHWTGSIKIGIVSIAVTPQIAVWIEDTSGKYIDTLYVTKKTAPQGWRGHSGQFDEKGKPRRKEPLPYWAFKRGVQSEDGLYAPSKKAPVADAVTSASPKKGFRLKSTVSAGLGPFAVLVEVNNSGAFNAVYTPDAKPGDPAFSGGKYGSGQPALVYRAVLDPGTGKTSAEFSLVGHSSPDGSDGNLSRELSSITTAKEIVGRMWVEVR